MSVKITVSHTIQTSFSWLLSLWFSELIENLLCGFIMRKSRSSLSFIKNNQQILNKLNYSILLLIGFVLLKNQLCWFIEAWNMKRIFFKLGADREHVLRMKYCPNDYYDKCRSVCFTVERTKKELIILIYSWYNVFRKEKIFNNMHVVSIYNIHFINCMICKKKTWRLSS